MSKTHGVPTAARPFFQESVRAPTSSSTSGSKSRDVLRAVPVPGGCPRFHVAEYARFEEARLQRDDLSPDLQPACRSTPPAGPYDLAPLLAISPADLLESVGSCLGPCCLDLPLNQRVPGARHNRLRVRPGISVACVCRRSGVQRE